MKATEASFFFGRKAYPVAERNLPEADVEGLVKAVMAQMNKLSGNFQLEDTEVNVVIAGEGYSCRFYAKGDEITAQPKAKRGRPAKAVVTASVESNGASEPVDE